MKKQTTISKVESHILRYGSITSGRIADFGVLNPYGIIDKLKRKGYAFETEKLKKRNITKYTWANGGDLKQKMKRWSLFVSSQKARIQHSK